MLSWGLKDCGTKIKATGLGVPSATLAPVAKVKSLFWPLSSLSREGPAVCAQCEESMGQRGRSTCHCDSVYHQNQGRGVPQRLKQDSWGGMWRNVRGSYAAPAGF